MSTDMLMLPKPPVLRFSAVADASDLSSAADRETAGLLSFPSGTLVRSEALHAPVWLRQAEAHGHKAPI